LVRANERCLLFAAYAAVLIAVVFLFQWGKRKGLFVWLLVLLSGGAFLGWGVLHPADWDEVEHLHATYLVSEGLLPFTDFWQIHSPLQWIVLAPLLKLVPQSGAVLVLARCLGLVLTGLLFLCVWRIARRLWGRDADLKTTLLVFLSASIVSQLLWLRPDLWMLLGSLVSIELALVGYEKDRGRYFFLGGLALSLGLTFTPKVAPWLLLVPLSSLVVHRRSLRRLLKTQVLHAAGVLSGAIPLAAYLTANGLWSGFREWVMVYHRASPALHLSFKAGPTLILLAASVIIGMVGLVKLPVGPGSAPRAVMGAALAVILLTAILVYPIEHSCFRYYLAPLFLVAATLSSWLGTTLVARGHPLRGAVLLGLLCAGLTFAHFRYADEARRLGVSLRNHVEVIDRLLERARGEFVQCVIPIHPIFRRDASRLYLPWQVVRLARRADTLKKRMLIDFLAASPSFAAELRRHEPTIIDPQRLAQAGVLLVGLDLLPSDELRDLAAWVDEHYHLERVSGLAILVRN